MVSHRPETIEKYEVQTRAQREQVKTLLKRRRAIIQNWEALYSTSPSDDIKSAVEAARNDLVMNWQEAKMVNTTATKRPLAELKRNIKKAPGLIKKYRYAIDNMVAWHGQYDPRLKEAATQ